jgi:hypothetical protein
MTFTFTRTLTTGVALSTGALLLAGCGIGDSPGDATTPAESTGEVEVVWKGDADRAASIQEALDLFNEANPDVKITTDYQSGGEYMQKMTIRFASGDAPDLMRQERETLRDYADRGVLLDLSGMDEIDTSAIPESVLESGKVDDKLYGIPGGITSFSYAIRADILEEYGIEVPDMETWTWDEMIDTAAQVTEASGGDVYGVDIPMGEISNLGIWLRQHGEDLWDADGKPAFTAATVQEWFEMYLHAVEVGAQPAPDALDAIGAAADQSSLGQGFIAIGSIPTVSNSVTTRASRRRTSAASRSSRLSTGRSRPRPATRRTRRRCSTSSSTTPRARRSSAARTASRPTPTSPRRWPTPRAKTTRSRSTRSSSCRSSTSQRPCPTRPDPPNCARSSRASATR